MNAILPIPLSLRILGLFLLGAAVGGWINLGAYRLAWRQRAISPWTPAPSGASRRRRSDLVPIIGWWFLSRDSALHGRGYWIRPLLVELFTGLLFAVLYWWDTQADANGLLVANGVLPRADFLTDNLPLTAHVRYVGHMVLVSLMLTASLIDVDEKTIPDGITIPGTVVALVLAALYPWSSLPAAYWLAGGKQWLEFLTIASPNEWPDSLGGWPLTTGLALALGCWTLWCGGLLPRRWNTRHGLRTAIRVFAHRLRVDGMTYRVLPLWLVGTASVALACVKLPDAHWASLLTSLVGMAAGGGVVWAVRIVGGVALRREAMGFGDVTLMSMIGAFVGWQAALIVFFLAPFIGLVIAIAQWIVHGEHEIPYGPFLCLATFGVIVDWPAVWSETSGIFSLGWLLAAMLAGCIVLMGLLLSIYRLVLTHVFSVR